MACPWFYPGAKMKFAEGTEPARAPLGAIYTGTCVAANVTPPRETLIELCNYGYGRDQCPYFNADTEADAVRFAFDRAGEVSYILEKSYAPLSSGPADSATATIHRQCEVLRENVRGWKTTTS